MRGRGAKLNKEKHPYQREQWIAKKREGRPKQVWVPSINTSPLSLAEQNALSMEEWGKQVLPCITEAHWSKVVSQ